MACPKLVGSLLVPRMVHSGEVKTDILLFRVVRIMASDIIFERMFVECKSCCWSGGNSLWLNLHMDLNTRKASFTNISSSSSSSGVPDLPCSSSPFAEACPEIARFWTDFAGVTIVGALSPILLSSKLLAFSKLCRVNRSPGSFGTGWSKFNVELASEDPSGSRLPSPSPDSKTELLPLISTVLPLTVPFSEPIFAKFNRASLIDNLVTTRSKTVPTIWVNVPCATCWFVFDFERRKML